MEIHQFSPATITPARSPSSVDEGDVGQNGSWYTRSRQRKQQQHQDREGSLTQPEHSSSHIDIRV